MAITEGGATPQKVPSAKMCSGTPITGDARLMNQLGPLNIKVFIDSIGIYCVYALWDYCLGIILNIASLNMQYDSCISITLYEKPLNILNHISHLLLLATNYVYALWDYLGLQVALFG